MGSLDFDDIVISPSMPIPELIKCIKHSFRDRDFNEFQDALMEREENFKKEIELLKRNPQWAKELDRLQHEENLGKSRRKCYELEEAVARVNEEKKLLTDQVKLAEKKSDLIFTENLMMTIEKNNSISALNEKIKELENRNMESERLAEVYREKCTCLETEIAKMDQELKDLRQIKSESDQVVEELKLANKTIKELENRGLESERLVEIFREKSTCLETEIAKTDQELKDLRQMKSESDRVVEDLKLANKTIEELKREKMELEVTLANSSIRMTKIEENYAKMLDIKVGDIASLVNDMGLIGTSEVGLNLDSHGHRAEKENSSRKDDAEVVVVDASLHANGSSDNGLSKNGARNSVQPPKIESIEPKEALGSGHNPPREKNNEPKEPLGSGANIGGMQLLSSSQKSSRSSPAAAAADIIYISDSDEEINPDGFLSTKVVKSKASTLVPTLFPSQTSKRSRTDCEEGFFSFKRKRDTSPADADLTVSTHEKERQTPKPTLFGINTSVEKFKVVSDEDSEDESLSDSKMMELVRNIGRKFKCKIDMLQAFQQDEELCMSSVCALYRHQAASKNRGFSLSDSASGCALAEYLIDGDTEHRLRKSVSDVKKQRPEVIDQCRKLANIYADKLLAIYDSGLDPYFVG